MIRRRGLISGGCATAWLTGSAAAAVPMVVAGESTSVARGNRILVAGPRNGRTDRWARAFALGLESGLSPGRQIRLQRIGGRGGVTGANRLQTMVVPDGKTAAMVPNQVAIAFLAGDPRVHFQPGEWISVVAGLSTAVLVVRGGLPRLSDPAPIRLAAASPESTDLAALLAFHRLGVATAPIFGLRGAAAVARAFEAGQADAVLLTGEEIPADAAPLAAAGGVAVGTLGALDSQDQPIGDPLFPDLPTIHKIAAARRIAPLPRPLERAYRAVAAASRLDFLMVLPPLTTPAAVARWRQAALGAVAMPALKDAADASAISLTVTKAAAAVAPLNVSPGELLALRQFLFRHFGWRPS